MNIILLIKYHTFINLFFRHENFKPNELEYLKEMHKTIKDQLDKLLDYYHIFPDIIK